MPDLENVLDELVPPVRPTAGDWDAVLRDARRVSRLRVGGPALVLAAVAALAVFLAWPLAGSSPSPLDRALAAVGDGPVVHVTFQYDSGGTLIDVASGRRIGVLHFEEEIWFDPSRGLHQITRFGGVVEGDAFRPTSKLRPWERELYSGLADGYRQALESGRVERGRSDVVDHIPVVWVKAHSELLPDVADGKLHEWAVRVAIARGTYEPVAMDETRDGKPGPETERRILELESLPAGAGDFSAPPDRISGRAMFEGPGRALTPAAAANAMGVPALWVGPAFDGLPLARVATTREGIARNREPASGWNIVNGLLLYYGDADDPCARVAFPSGRCAGKGAFVAVREQPRLLFAFQYFPPEGQLLLEEGPTGLLRRDGVYVTIDAPSEGLVLAAARALEPMSRG